MITTTASAVVATAALASFLTAAKAPNTALHPTVHPTGQAATTSAGASGGGVYGLAHGASLESDRRIVRPGYGEGWLRFGNERSQLEVRLTPASTYLTYRRDLAAPCTAVGFAVAATLGLAYGHRTSATQRMTNSFAIAPSFAVLCFPGGGRLYLAARYGFQWRWDLVSYTNYPSQSTTANGARAVGGAVGWLLHHGPIAYSLELSVVRAWTASDTDRIVAYAIVPSLAMQLGDAACQQQR